jgi:tight adherence protein B
MAILIAARYDKIYCILAVLLLFAIHVFKIYKKKKRIKRFSKQFVPAINQIISNIKAGLSLEEALKNISERNPEPLAQEFERIITDYRISKDFAKSLKALYERIPAAEVLIFVNSVIISRRTGANLVEQLLNIRRTLTDRFYAEGKISAMTVQGKTQGFIAAFLPLAIILTVNHIDPFYFDPVINTSAGRSLIVFSAVMNLLGLVLILKLSDIKF